MVLKEKYLISLPALGWYDEAQRAYIRACELDPGNAEYHNGEIDDNVDPSSTYQVVNALEKANKDFELVVIPGAHHTMGELYGEHKRYDFFVKNLLGVKPPKWSDVKSK